MRSEKRFLFWQQWLVWANILAVGVGLLVAFAGNSFFFAPHNAQTVQVFFDGNPPSTEMMAFKNWLFGVIGGTIVGFHLLMIFIARNAFSKKERWAYYALWLGLISWFVIDSSLSAFYGAAYNVYLINIPAFAGIGLPLLMTRKYFSGN